MNKGNSADDLLPKFFKVYLPDESGDDLKIPISFTSFLPNPSPKTVTVRSISGSVWKLAFRKKCSGDVESFVVVNGWKLIAKDENLKGGDFLEFEFDGSRHFNFCIYERETMCKRVRSCSEQSQEIKVESESEEETRASDDVLAVDEDDEDDDDDDDEDDSDYDSDVALEEEDNDGDESDDYVVDDDASEDYDDVEADAAGDGRCLLDDPENPSFTLRLNPKKKSQLLIPAQVIKDYGLHFPESITMVDPLVKKFGTLEKQIKIQTNGSVFVKGFGSIIRRNNVKTTDKIICEIKKTGDNNLVQTMKIHILTE